jgi:hypothetical protein
MSSPHSSLPENDLTAAKFESLLLRLDPDRNRAGEKYEDIRWRLIKFFQYGFCVEAEDLADETFDRVAEKLAAEKEAIRDVAAFVWGVAKRIRQEALRREVKTVRMPDLPGAEGSFADARVTDNSQRNLSEAEKRLTCLRKCLQHLSAGDRRLLLTYYSPRGDRIGGRRRLAQENEMTALNLRVRANRLRFKMEQYIKKCLASTAD